MRGVFPVLVLVAALGLAFALRALAPATPNPGPELLGISAPTTVLSGETYPAYGGLSLPDGHYEKRLVVCGPERCNTGGWGAVTGPGDWWGFLGSFNPPTPGRYEAKLLLFHHTSFGARVLAGFLTWTVDAR